MQPRLLSVLTLLLFASATRAQGRVWRVAPSGGDFTQISAAVNAAQSGDVILVSTAPTPYAAFNGVGKALTIMSGDGGKPEVLGRTEVWGVPPGGVYRLANMRFKGHDGSPTIGTDTYAFGFSSNATTPPVTLLMSGCDVEASRGYWSPLWERPAVALAAIYVDGGGFSEAKDALVVLDRVRAVGHGGATGLLAGDLTVHANQCLFLGGDAMLRVNISRHISHGGAGALLGPGQFYFAECDIRGGSVPPQTYGDAQNGGDGMILGTYQEPADVILFSRHTTVAGGNSGNLGIGSHGGYGLDMWFTNSQVYTDGQPFVGGRTLAGQVGQMPAVSGSPAPLPRALGALSFDRPVADLGTQVVLNLSARPQEPHLLLANAMARQVPIAGILEPLPIAGLPTWFPLAVVTTGPAGGASLPLSIPNDPLLATRTLFVQGLGIDVSSLQLIVDSLCSVTLR